MFKPVDVYCSKKAKKLENADENELRIEYFKLDDSKTLKFIKKAESKYDSHVEQNPDEILPPFSDFLSRREVNLLFKHYGMPEKPAANSRQAMLTRFKHEAQEQNPDDKNIYQTAIDRYNALSTEEKNNSLNEYQQTLNEYNEEFFTFARNLPSQRVIDYRNFISYKKNVDTDDSDTPKRRPAQVSQAAAAQTSKKDKKEACKNFLPITHFIKKASKEEFEGLPSLVVSNKLRTKYAALPDKKKLKYIKEAEAAFNTFDFSEIGEPKQLLSTFLRKNELKVLFDSYGLPETVPHNANAYFFKLQMRAGTSSSMKDASEKYKNMDEQEKKSFAKEFSQAYEDFEIKQKEFLARLPEQRLADYKTYKANKTALRRTVLVGVENGGSSSSRKDKKESKSSETVDNDDDTDLSENESQEVKKEALSSSESEVPPEKVAPKRKAAESASNGSKKKSK